MMKIKNDNELIIRKATVEDSNVGETSNGRSKFLS